MKDTITSEPIQVCIDANRLARNILICFISLEVGFVLLDIFFNFLEFSKFKTIQNFCNIAREDSLSSWFGSTQTLLAGLTLWVIFVISKNSGDSRKIVVGWLIMALFFTYMAVDDGAEVHERMGTYFELISEDNGKSADSESWATRLLEFFPSYSWQLLFMPFFGALGIFALFFLWNRLDAKPARIMILLALGCFATAVFLDFIEGLEKNHPWNFHTMLRETYHLKRYTVRHFAKSLEEFLEMVGISLFWASFVHYFRLLPEAGVRLISVSDRNS